MPKRKGQINVECTDNRSGCHTHTGSARTRRTRGWRAANRVDGATDARARAIRWNGARTAKVNVLGWLALVLCWCSAATASLTAEWVSFPGGRVRVQPISGGLGLADVSVEMSEAGPAPVLVVRSDGERSPTNNVPMRRVPESADAASDPAARFVARLRTGGPAVAFRVRLGDGAGEAGPFEFSTAPDADDATPDWAKGCVWYQIFPERFRNGNRDNDPRGQAFFRKPWTSRWHGVDADELESAWSRAWARPFSRGLSRSRPRGQLDNVVFDRRYGGDLQGIVEKLDELHDLGVDALYLNPIFHAQSLHKYDASDYRHIDPTLGHPGTPSAAELENRLGETLDPSTWVWTEADRYFIDVLLVEARKRGMRVVIDGVWNHVGTDFWAFRDVLERGAASPYASWFEARFADPQTYPGWLNDPADLRPGALVGWKSWGGGGRNGGLPELARDAARGRQRLLPEIEAHIWSVTQRWMDPNGDGDPSDGIDGWRLDVVPDMPTPFWQAWRNHVKRINPDAVLHCEVWFDAKDYFEARAFDGQMNYPFAMPMIRWLSGEAGMPSDRLAAALERAFQHPARHDLVQMNLLMSHDTDRLVSRLANPGREYDQGAQMSARGTGYNDRKPEERYYDLSVLGVAIQSTYMGAPMVYNGDELGMYGADDPDCRKPMPWSDQGALEDPDEAGRADVRERYRDWLRLRRDPRIGDVLRYGRVDLVASEDPDVLVFDRSLNGQVVRVIANRGSREVGRAKWIPPGAERVEVGGTGDSQVVGARSAGVWVWVR